MGVFTSKMRLLTAVVIEDKSDLIAKELLRAGLLDFIKVTKAFDMGDISLEGGASAETEVGELRRRIENLYRQASIRLPSTSALSVEEMDVLDLALCRSKVDEAVSEIQDIRAEQKKVHQEILKLDEIGRYLRKSDDAKSGAGGFLIINRGRPVRGTMKALTARLSQIPFFESEITGGDEYLLISLKRDRAVIGEVLSSFGWLESDVSSNEKSRLAAGADIKERRVVLEQKMETVQGKLKDAVLWRKAEFDELWKNLRLHELFGEIKNNFSHTRDTCIFSGWLPAERSTDLERIIRSVSGGSCIVRWSDPEDHRKVSVPVEIRHTKVLAPFKMLVENFGVPEYGTIDPTIFVAVAYLAMFGLMFGDVGQGFVIMMVGLLGGLLTSKSSAGLKRLLQLFVFCGISSIIAGVLFGSYFGYSFFPPLWFDYHGIIAGHSETGGGRITDVYDILRITIYFGIIVISTGLVLNWINLFRKRNFFKLFLDKSGIIGGWFYGCGLWAAFQFVAADYKSLPDAGLMAVLFGIPVLILLLKAPLQYILHERGRQEFNGFKIVDFIMEWLVELLEIFSGYLANTLSFMRVAGLGIAHVSLMVAFDSIAAMSGNGFAAALILILGNLLVIALEGLSAGIQALRLNYYEFFSRYFTGKGIAYNPVSLRNRKQED